MITRFQVILTASLLAVSGALFAARDASDASVDTARSLRRERVAVSYPAGAIRVFSGNGRLIRTWKPRLLWKQATSRRVVAYYWPDVHPDQDRILCIKCIEDLVELDNGNVAPQKLDCSITEMTLQDQGQNDLIPLTPGKVVSSPAYSPDGSMLAFLQEENVVLVNVRDRKAVTSIPSVLATPPESLSAQLTNLKGWAPWTPYLRWAADGSRVFVLGPRPLPIPDLVKPLAGSPPEGVASVELSSGRVTWMNLFQPVFIHNRYFGRYTEVLDGNWHHVQGPLPNAEAINVLFGSNKHPVLTPSFVLDRRYYLYLYPDEGWFWKTSIMRYDVSASRVKNVHVLESGLYRE